MLRAQRENKRDRRKREDHDRDYRKKPSVIGRNPASERRLTSLKIKSKNRSAALAEKGAPMPGRLTWEMARMVTSNEHGTGMYAPANASVGIRFESNGTVTLISKTVDYGHGHAAPFFAHLLMDRLGIPFSRIRLYFTGVRPAAKRTPKQIAQPLNRTGGCKSILRCRDAIGAAAAKVIEQGRQLAADILEASPVDIEFLVETSGGYFRIVGTDRGIHIMALASRVRSQRLIGTLDVRHDQARSRNRVPSLVPVSIPGKRRRPSTL
jgi:CO/xanthine dehydrogenase Mo-binding subunit